jgi:hypothetical protein
MRKMISGLVAALAVIAAGAVPAKACGFGCSPCGYVSPCGAAYVQPYYSGCGGCGAVYERLPDPDVQYHSAPIAMPQYYYVNQGPTYTGPGDFAPHRVYQEGGVYGWGYHHRHYGYHAYGHYPWHHHHHWYRYGGQHVLHSYY